MQTQVLLTRSSFLADKLRAYINSLISTLEAKSLDLEAFHHDENVSASAAQEIRLEESALSLGDESFPLVLTFDHFLDLLENTIR